MKKNRFKSLIMQCYTMTRHRFGGVCTKPASVVISLAVPHSKALNIYCAARTVPISVLSCKQRPLSSCEAGTYSEDR